jgi:hypothetical protein
VSAQRAETIAQYLREKRWLLERGEMAAPIELVPVNEPGEETLGPAAGRGDNLAGRRVLGASSGATGRFHAHFYELLTVALYKQEGRRDDGELSVDETGGRG